MSGALRGPARPGRRAATCRATGGPDDGESPRVAFRVPAELKRALRNAAHRTGRRESELAREALERYLAR